MSKAIAGFLGKAEPTKENYAAKVREQYGENAGEILKLLSRQYRRPSEGVRPRPGECPIYRLFHLEVAGHAAGDGKISGVSLSLRASSSDAGG